MNAKRGRKPQCAHDQAAALPGAYYAVAAKKSAGNYSPGADRAGRNQPRHISIFTTRTFYALMDQMEAAQLARLNDLMDTLIPSISQEDAPPRWWRCSPT
mgnify:CR=1 FL=1